MITSVFISLNEVQQVVKLLVLVSAGTAFQLLLTLGLEVRVELLLDRLRLGLVGGADKLLVDKAVFKFLSLVLRYFMGLVIFLDCPSLFVIGLYLRLKSALLLFEDATHGPFFLQARYLFLLFPQ